MITIRTLTSARLRTLALLGALFLVSACPASAKWKFMFFSDTQDPEWGPWLNTNIMTELAIAVTNEKPAFVLFGGDMANAPSPPVPPLWTNLMGPVYAAGIPIYPVIGNHDMWEVPGFINAFGPTIPDNGPIGELNRTYFVQHSNVLVLAMDAFIDGQDYRVNQAWVDAVLATNQLPHVFAFSHPAAFKLSHGNCLGAYPAERDRFWRSLASAGCRMYFSGHDHFFDHTRLDDGDGNTNNDVHQYITGTAGAAFYADDLYNGTNGPFLPVRITHEANYGYVVVEINDLEATATWKHRVSPNVYEATSDVFKFRVVPRILVAAESEIIKLTWTGTATLQSSSDIAGPFTNVVSATSPYTVTNPTGGKLFFRLSVP